MLSRLISIVVLVVLLVSCAQVGSISGGPVDDSPPQVKSMTPENKSLNFNGNGFEIEFEDFVKLNNPAQTISVIPADFKVKTSVKGKTLNLSWEEPLKENTTYSIFLNKTVQDITEGNDSLIQIVFSTGNVLDSLTYSTFVQDALSKDPSKKVMVGLFEAEDSLKPMYFAQTDDLGKATFNYLKQGTYFVRAFDDVNKDLKISKTEKVGFIKDPILLDSAMVDSIPFQLFTPLLPPKINSVSFQSPGAFVIAANRSLVGATIEVNKTVIDSNSIEFLAKDSLRLFYVPTEQAPVQFVINSNEFNDTTNVRIIENAKNKALIIQAPIGNSVSPSTPISFSVLDAIALIDTSKIKILQLPDSTIIKDYNYIIEKNRLTLDLPRKNAEKFVVEFDAGAITGNSSSKNNRSNTILKVLQEKELGILNLDLSSYSNAIILQVFLAGKKTNELPITQPSILKLNDLAPGDYTFRVILDENQNGTWDTGNFIEKIQPEEIQTFSEPTKVRANWEIELKLVPKN